MTKDETIQFINAYGLKYQHTSNYWDTHPQHHSYWLHQYHSMDLYTMLKSFFLTPLEKAKPVRVLNG